jgi:hypothetical protein
MIGLRAEKRPIALCIVHMATIWKKPLYATKALSFRIMSASIYQ